MKTKPHHKLPATVSGYYGVWIASFPEGEQRTKIYQCGSVLRCVQMTDTDFVPCGCTRWQLNLTNMAGLGFLESDFDTVDFCKGYPVLSLKPCQIRISVIDNDHLCVSYGAFGSIGKVTFTRELNEES